MSGKGVLTAVYVIFGGVLTVGTLGIVKSLPPERTTEKDTWSASGASR